ncbi:MAG: TlpA family protein disulfide reductase [Clostridiales bacterium]|nr:TlpA family protein disulfide reductase [Clostridiales bacterium]
MKRFLAMILCGAMALSIASCTGAEDERPTLETHVTTASDTTGTPVAPTATDADFSPDFTFKTTDRVGNEYDERVFSSYKLTMINFWEPWCGPCVNEMPDIGRLYEAYKDKGFQVLGVYSETEMEDEVLSIIGKSKVSYPILRYTSEFDRFQTGYVPTTVFVDSKGHIIQMSDGTDSVIGSQSYEEWEKIVKQYL